MEERRTLRCGAKLKQREGALLKRRVTSVGPLTRVPWQSLMHVPIENRDVKKHLSLAANSKQSFGFVVSLLTAKQNTNKATQQRDGQSRADKSRQRQRNPHGRMMVYYLPFGPSNNCSSTPTDLSYSLNQPIALLLLFPSPSAYKHTRHHPHPPSLLLDLLFFRCCFSNLGLHCLAYLFFSLFFLSAFFLFSYKYVVSLLHLFALPHLCTHPFISSV